MSESLWGLIIVAAADDSTYHNCSHKGGALLCSQIRKNELSDFLALSVFVLKITCPRKTHKKLQAKQQRKFKWIIIFKVFFFIFCSRLSQKIFMSSFSSSRSGWSKEKTKQTEVKSGRNNLRDVIMILESFIRCVNILMFPRLQGVQKEGMRLMSVPWDLFWLTAS